jgi:hypothetical protein
MQTGCYICIMSTTYDLCTPCVPTPWEACWRVILTGAECVPAVANRVFRRSAGTWDETGVRRQTGIAHAQERPNCAICSRQLLQATWVDAIPQARGTGNPSTIWWTAAWNPQLLCGVLSVAGTASLAGAWWQAALVTASASASKPHYLTGNKEFAELQASTVSYQRQCPVWLHGYWVVEQQHLHHAMTWSRPTGNLL